MPTQTDKAIRFRALHQGPRILVMPNPWDTGSAKLLASLGFEALATTSLGVANMLGVPDGEGRISREALLENCRVLCEATDLPVTKPVNVVMGWMPPDATVQQLQDIGVRRISIGGALSRVAMGAFYKAAQDLSAGSFAWIKDAMQTKKLKDTFRG